MEAVQTGIAAARPPPPQGTIAVLPDGTTTKLQNGETFTEYAKPPPPAAMLMFCHYLRVGRAN